MGIDWRRIRIGTSSGGRNPQGGVLRKIISATIEPVKFNKICFALLILTSCATPPRPAAKLDPTVLLISLDGYRWDYPQKYPSPNLDAFRKKSTRAERLLPVFPTTTFANHYSIVTGLYAEDHGVVGNEMFDPTDGDHFFMRDKAKIDDPKWWGGEPIWVTAEKQGLPTGTVFWVGSNAAIQGVRPRHYLAYDGSISAEARVRKVLEWLALPASERPRFLTLYFEDVDSAGHQFGPDSPEVPAAIARIDAAMGVLRQEVEKNGWDKQMDVLFVSDHGMAPVAPDHVVRLEPELKGDGVEVSGYGAVIHFFAKGKSLAALEGRLKRPGVTVYRKGAIPSALHYSKHARIGDLVALADEGWYLIPPGGKQGNQKGAHGYLPHLPSMHGIFFASGPSFREDTDVGPIHNVSLYAVMTKILGLKPAANRGVASEVATIKSN